MAESPIRVEFDGPAVADGQMTARWVGETLLAMSDLVAEIKSTDSQLTQASAPELKVASVDHDSFDINLVLQAVGDLWEQIRTIAGGPDVTAVANLTAVVGAVVGTIKLVGIRRVRDSATSEDGGEVTLFLDDGTVVVVSTETFLAFMNATLAPSGVTVTKQDFDSFQSEDPTEPPEDTTRRRTARVQPMSVNFQRERWRVSEGGPTFTVRVEDEDFLRRLDRGDALIGKTDTFEVGLRTEQSVGSDGKLRVQYAIERVISQNHGHVQPQIDLTRGP